MMKAIEMTQSSKKISFSVVSLQTVTLYPLTVALILGTSVPKGSKMTITAEMNVIAQK